jgi:hypothetical protein
MPKQSNNRRSGRRPRISPYPTRRRSNQLMTAEEDTQMLSNLDCITSPGYSDVPRMVLRRQKVHTITQSYDAGGVYSTGSGANFGAYNFQFGNLPDYSYYQAVFDQFRVAQIEFTFLPQYNTNNSGTSSPGQFLTVIDYDDSTTLTSWGQGCSYDNAVITQATNAQRRTLNPKIAIAAYTGSFSGYALGAQWVDVKSTSAIWYGLKWVLQNSFTNTDEIYTCQCRVTLQFKNSV